MDKKRIILLTQGGAGDVFAQTVLPRCFKKKYPEDEIIVLSTYHQIWENNPNVDKVIHLKEPRDFYGEYILGHEKEIRFFKKRFMYDYLWDDCAKGSKNLLDLACKTYDIEYDGLGTEYYISDYEKRFAMSFISQSKKPVVLLHVFSAVASDGGHTTMVCGGCGGRGVGQDGNRCQVCGGSGKVVSRSKTNSLKDLDPAVVGKLVAKYKDKYDFLQIGLEAEPRIEGSFDCLGMPMRDAIALIPEVKSFIFIESLFAHAAGALKKPGVVVFQNTSPEFFGYSTALNISNQTSCDQDFKCGLWPCNRPVGALLDFGPGYRDPKSKSQFLWECPNQKCKFDDFVKLEEAFLKSIEEPKKLSCHKTYQEALKA